MTRTCPRPQNTVWTEQVHLPGPSSVPGFAGRRAKRARSGARGEGNGQADGSGEEGFSRPYLTSQHAMPQNSSAVNWEQRPFQSRLPLPLAVTGSPTTTTKCPVSPLTKLFGRPSLHMPLSTLLCSHLSVCHSLHTPVRLTGWSPCRARPACSCVDVGVAAHRGARLGPSPSRVPPSQG